MLNLKKVKKIFVDFDGVVVDSNAFKEKAIENSVFKLLGKNKKTFEAISFFNENAGIARNLKLSKFFTKEIVTKILKLYSEACLEFFSKVRPEENLKEFLKTIKSKDKNIKFYILSGGEKKEIIFFLRNNCLYDFFDEILASDKNKLDHLKEKEASESDIFIGDSKNDLKTALNYDLKFILFRKYKSLKSFPSQKTIKENVLLEAEDFKSLINEIEL